MPTWVGSHEELLPRLLQQLTAGGVLAVQIPHNGDSPAQVALRSVAEAAALEGKPKKASTPSGPRAPEDYYRILAAHCSSVELWQTIYMRRK